MSWVPFETDLCVFFSVLKGSKKLLQISYNLSQLKRLKIKHYFGVIKFRLTSSNSTYDPRTVIKEIAIPTLPARFHRDSPAP